MGDKMMQNESVVNENADERELKMAGVFVFLLIERSQRPAGSSIMFQNHYYINYYYYKY